MSERMLFRLYRGQVEAMAETVEAWKTEHDRAMRARDVEDIVRSCLDYPARMGQLWKTTSRQFSDQQFDLNAAWYSLQEAFTKTLHFLDGVRELVREVEATGHSVAGSADLESARSRVAALREDIFRFWEPFTEEHLREAWEEHLRGECLELDEAFAEIAGLDKASWLRKVQEYRENRNKNHPEGTGDELPG